MSSFTKQVQCSNNVSRYLTNNTENTFLCLEGVLLLSMKYLNDWALKKPIQLPTIRTAWNLGLAIFSAIGFSRVAPAIFITMQNRGFTNTICSSLDFLGSGPSGLWTLLFTLSKVAELGDTLLLLIHGKELSFLHVFHHSTVLIWSWQQYVEASAPNFIYCALNLFVHTLMYTYFAIAQWKGAANLRTTAVIITATQCSQFVIGLVVSIWAGVVSLSSQGTNAICSHDVPCSCRFNFLSFVFSLFFYFSYLILFLNFANKAYALTLRFSILFNGSTTDAIRNRPWTDEKLNLEQKFKAACGALPLYRSKMAPEDGIKLYGLYKQSMVGDINANDLETSTIATEKGYNDYKTLVSSGLDQTIIKCAAWKICRGKNSEECMESYVSLVNDISFGMNENNNCKKLKKI